jgi:hypothetical protein
MNKDAPLPAVQADELKVTQADLDASAELADVLNLLGTMQGIDTRIESDFAKSFFARHRIATETQSQATIDALLDEIRNMPGIALAVGQEYGEDETGWLDCSDTIATALQNVARSILSRHTGEGE